VRRRLVTVAFAILVLVTGASFTPALGSTPNSTSNSSRVDYAASDAVIANPDRGFYHHTETHAFADGTGYEPLDPAELRAWRSTEQITQILRVFYLERFVGADLSAAYLDQVRADFRTAREAGVKVVVRFAYAKPKDAWPYQPPYGDAPKSRVLRHIDQLEPVLRGNADVIAAVQAGFIGLWGEWYYTDHFVADPANPGEVTDADWAARRAVVLALLDALPESRMVQVRTMMMKQRIFSRPTGAGGALTPREAYSGRDVARVGHHNDCFLASPDDFGTFLSDPITLDQEYLELDSRYVPVGGETCNVNPPRSEWPSASAEMARYHYSYLNTDYNRLVLESWGAGIEEARKRLGYRFALLEGEFTDRVRPSSSMRVSLSVANEGWAAPYNKRGVQLILRSAAGSYAVDLREDPRRWAPGRSSSLSARICASVPAGRYSVLLNLRAAERSLSSPERNADYAIQLANAGVWEPATGYNDLGHTLTVSKNAPWTSDCDHALRPYRVAG
jgi:hypothetical protein